jgi:hypothetical protein
VKHVFVVFRKHQYRGYSNDEFDGVFATKEAAFEHCRALDRKHGYDSRSHAVKYKLSDGKPAPGYALYPPTLGVSDEAP